MLMSTKLSLREALAQRDEIPAERPRPSGFRVEVELQMAGPIDQPVSLARQLRSYGLSLREAHAALNEIVKGKLVQLTLYTQEPKELVGTFAGLGVSAVTLPGTSALRA